MLNLAMCVGLGCQRRNTCRRYRAVPSEEQRWTSADAFLRLEGWCSNHEPLRDGEEIMPHDWQEGRP